MKILKISICLVVCMAFLLVGCQQKQDNSIDNVTQNENKEPVDDTTEDEDKEPVDDLYIEIRSAGELAKMREMANCSDAKLLEDYLQTSGSGARSKEELEQFIKLIDTVPYVSMIEGDLTWICHNVGKSIDTGKPFDILSVAIESENGEWVRIEYNLLVSDVSEKITSELKEMDASLVLTKPIQSKDKKITVYAENRKVQTAGKSIWWTVDIDGIFARIIYGTDKMDTVKTQSVFSNCSVTDIESAVVK